MSWKTSTDSIPCDCPMFILKLPECKQAEFSSDSLAAFVNF